MSFEISPVLNDFSSGFVSSKMAGRVDNQLLIRGAKRMVNCYPGSFGEVCKSGGIESKMVNISSSSARLIKWSISNEVDLIFVFMENMIKVIDVSSGQEPSFVTNGDGDLEITSITDGNGEEWPIEIAESALNEISYAQNLKEMIVCHRSFKPIRFEFIEKALTDITFEMSFLEFSGNIASSKTVSVKTSYEEMTYAYLKGIFLDKLDATTGGGVEYVATGTIREGTTDKIIDAITASQVIENTKLVVTKGGGSLGFTNGTYTATGNTPERLVIGTKIKSRGWGPWTEVKVDDILVDFASGTSWDTVLDYCKTALKDGDTYVCGDDDDYHYTASGFPSKAVFSHTPYSYTITISYSGGPSDDVLNSVDDSVFGELSIPSLSIDVNGYKTTMQDTLGRILPWMDYDKQYNCAQGGDYIINGYDAISAYKAVRDGKQQLIISTYNGQVVLNDESEGFTGKIGVILTPFYNSIGGQYPECVGYYGGRLCFGFDNELIMSKVHEHQNFCYFEDVEFESTQVIPSDQWANPDEIEYATITDYAQQVVASSAIRLKLAMNEDESIKWISPVSGLHIGSATSEWFIPQGFDATNVSIQMTSRIGGTRIDPVFVDGRLITVSGDGMNLFAIDPQNPFNVSNITEHAREYFDSRISCIDFRQYPSHEVFVVKDNGEMLVGRMAVSGIYGWSKRALSGTDVFLSVSCIFAQDEDAVYVATDRSSIVCMDRIITTDDSLFSGRKYLDYAEYVDTPGSTIIDKSRLYGRTNLEIRLLSGSTESAGTCEVESDGTIINYTPYLTGVEVAIPSFDAYHLGCMFDMDFETQNIDIPETEGLGKGMSKVIFRFLDSGYSSVLSPNGVQNPIQFNSYPFTGSKKYDILSSGGETPDKTVRIISSRGEPLTIQVIRPIISVGDTL